MVDIGTDAHPVTKTRSAATTTCNTARRLAPWFQLTGIEIAAVPNSLSAQTIARLVKRVNILELLDQRGLHRLCTRATPSPSGPQGTLYGATSLGGTIKYIPNAPSLSTFGVDVGAQVAFTEHGHIDHAYTGMVNMPIGDIAAVRVDGYQVYDSGYAKDPVFGRDNQGWSRSEGGRIALLPDTARGDFGPERDDLPDQSQVSYYRRCDAVCTRRQRIPAGWTEFRARARSRQSDLRPRSFVEL